VIKTSRENEAVAAVIPRGKRLQCTTTMQEFLGHAHDCDGEPLGDVVVKLLRTQDIAGAIEVLDVPEKIAKAAQGVQGRMEEGLIVFSHADFVGLVRPRAIGP